MKYITSTPNIMGGAAAIAGTRIPMARIIFLLKEGYTVGAIHDEYPWVDTSKIEGAIDELAELVDLNTNAARLS